jgi:hypothetical protein
MKRALGWILLIVIAAIFAFILIRRSQLKRDFAISNATITRVGNNISKDRSVEFVFTTTDGTIIHDANSLPVYPSMQDKLVGRTIPVAYYLKDPTQNQLLIYKHTWKQYKLEQPDSLNWVSDYFDMGKVLYTY